MGECLLVMNITNIAIVPLSIRDRSFLVTCDGSDSFPAFDQCV